MDHALVRGVGKQDGQERPLHQSIERLRAAVERLAEYRLCVVELAAHALVLRSLAGEEVRDPGRRQIGTLLGRAVRVLAERGQLIRKVAGRAADQRVSSRKVRAAGVGAEREVAGGHVGPIGQR